MKYLFFLFILFLSGCGGGGGGGGAAPSAPVSVSTNVAPGSNVMTLYAAPASVNVNILLASVTFCTPNTSNCQTIPNLLVDTGSYGIRLLKSAMPSALQLSPVTGSGGNPLYDCSQFASGYTWGSVQTADVKMSGETAYGLPVQVIDDVSTTQNPAIPAACPGPFIGNVQGLNANGVIGIGVFLHDCGQYCVNTPGNNIYFECPTSGCASHAEPLNVQIQNPVPNFSGDNNGVVVVLPQIPSSGAAGISGSLIFGIGTRSNNALGQAKVLPLDGYGNFTTTFNGQSLSTSFIDSGSNMFFFQDGTTPACTYVVGGYCPSSTQSLSATLGSAITVNFSVANADQLISTGNLLFSNMAGSAVGPTSFDWGLPFFFGRSVYFAINGSVTPYGTGPYVAF